MRSIVRADAFANGGAGIARAVRADMWVAALATLALGGGAVVAAGAAGSGSLALAAAAGAAAAAGLVILIAAGWVDGLLVTVLAVPLPALLSTPDMRIATAAPITAAVVAGWLLGAASLRAAPGLRLVHHATIALLATMALATIFASSVATSLRELLNMIVLFALFLLALPRMRAAATGDRVVHTLIALAGICGVLAVLEMVGVLPGSFPRWGTSFHRAALGFGQPNGLGLFLAITLPLSVHLLRVSRGPARVAALCALAATAAGLFATFSRGSWLAVLGGAIALVFVRDRRLLVRVLGGAVVFGVLLDMASGGMLRDTAVRTLTDWVVEQRAALMLAGIMMFLAHPITGVGPGGFAVELDTVGAQITSLWDYMSTPHNAYVQMAAETGVIGLSAYIVFLLVCFAQLVRAARAAAARGASAEELSLRHCLLWSFGVICCAGMVVWPFAHGTGQAVMLVLAAGLARETT